MKRRGAARVLAVDTDDAYLRQARFAAQVVGVDIEFAQLSVYDVAALAERFDLVLFLGVLYHLRHPLLALDLIREHVVRDLFVCQSMQRGSPAEATARRKTIRSGKPRSSNARVSRAWRLSSMAMPATAPTGGSPTAPAPRRCCAAPGLSSTQPRGGGVRLPAGSGRARQRRLPGPPAATGQRSGGMIEAVMLWNEPNNKSHWDLELDPDWSRFARMARARRGRHRRSGTRAAAGAGRHLADRPGVHRQPRRAGRARPARRGRGARFSARLEFVADRRLAGQARRDRRRHRSADLGLRMRRFELWRGGGAGIRPAPHRRAA